LSGDRTDASGRAYAGSQCQIQTYVNRHPDRLTRAILSAIPELSSLDAVLEWVSPLEKELFQEYRDGAFLAALGLTELGPALADFWPRGGPQWDALARIIPPSFSASGRPSKVVPEMGALLVEAKSYPGEMIADGCRAAGRSRTKIERSLAEARQWLEAGEGDWCGSFYQLANRLAHVYFLRERAGTPAWLVNLCFVDDPRSPTSEEEWQQGLAAARAALGLGPAPVPYVADVFLPGLGKELFEDQSRGMEQ
jgi:hypothetical protein